MPRSIELSPLARRLAVAAFGAVSSVALLALALQSHPAAPPARTWAAAGASAAHPAPSAPRPVSVPAPASTPSAPAAVRLDDPAPNHPRAAVPAPAAPTASPGRVGAEAVSALKAALRPGSPARSTRAARPVTEEPRVRPAAERAATRKAVKPAARNKAVRAKRAIRPFGAGSVTRSHYLRHLVDGPVDLPRMRALGARDARHNRSGQPHVVLLDIGGQTGGGVLLSTTTRWVSYSGLARAVTAYARGYHAHQRRSAPVTIAIGTNNDLAVSYGSGRQWARQVVRPVAAATKRYAKMRIAGANDIEPGFRAGPGRTRQWVRGYLSATRAPLVFNGSADGCSASHPNSHCQHGWTARDLAWMAGTAAPKRITALPQVYNPTMAGQWAMISLTAVRHGHPPLRFHGPLTENAACRGHKHCPTMNSGAAWRALWNSLRLSPATTPKMLPSRSDLDVH